MPICLSNVFKKVVDILLHNRVEGWLLTVFCPGFQKGRVPSEKGTLAR